MAVYGCLELFLRLLLRRALGIVVALFEIVVVLVLRAHWTMDVFAGAVTALWIGGIAGHVAAPLDRWLGKRRPRSIEPRRFWRWPIGRCQRKEGTHDRPTACRSGRCCCPGHSRSSSSTRIASSKPNPSGNIWIRTDRANIPLFECPDRDVTTTYYYRWELVTKHLVYGSPEDGYAFTEFIDRPFWSGHVWRDLASGGPPA